MLFIDPYLDIEQIATLIIDEVLKDGVQFVEHELKKEILFKPVVKPKSITRPDIENFTAFTGFEYIHKLIATWKRSSDWMYCLDFVSEFLDECSTYFCYEAKWSIPTKEYPIPQVTASVYFTIEVSRVMPSTSKVNVSYVFEGNRLVHTAEKMFWNEIWLRYIINNKISFLKTITF